MRDLSQKPKTLPRTHAKRTPVLSSTIPRNSPLTSGKIAFSPVAHWQWPWLSSVHFFQLPSDVFLFFHSVRSRLPQGISPSSDCSEYLPLFCRIGSSEMLPSALSSCSEIPTPSALKSSAPQISAPAAVNPSAWDFVGSGLGVGWDVLGSPHVHKVKLTTSKKQNEVDHLSQIEVDHGFKIQVDLESKNQTDHLSKIQVDHPF